MNDRFPADFAAAGGGTVGCFGEFVLAGDVFVGDEVAHGGCVGSCLEVVSSIFQFLVLGKGRTFSRLLDGIGGMFMLLL